MAVDVGAGARVVRAAEEGAGVNPMVEPGVRPAAGVADPDLDRRAASRLRSVEPKELVPPRDVRAQRAAAGTRR